MLGTIINVITVTTGSLIGIGLGQKLQEKYTEIVFHALGLFTLFLGVQMGFKTGNPLILVLSLILGGLIGEAFKFKERTEQLVSRFRSSKSVEAGDHRFTNGLISAFMIFCIGSLTILGCLEEGLNGKRDLIITKSIMDFFSSMALASAFGKGVLFSVIPLFLYQGGLTLGAGYLKDVLSTAMQAEMIALGGLMLLGLGFNILKIKEFKIINFVPGLVIAPLLTYFAEHFEVYSF